MWCHLCGWNGTLTEGKVWRTQEPSSTTSEVSKHIYIRTTPTTTSRWRTLRSYQLNINGLKEEWRKLFTSEPWILHWRETVDVTTCPWSGITSSRREWRMEQGPPMEGGGARPEEFWDYVILTKAAVIAESSVSAVKFFILCNEVTNI